MQCIPAGPCIDDDDCSDGLFCNGRERCDQAAVGADARGCAPARGRPCLDVQRCFEETDRCDTDCPDDRDADDDGADANNCPGGNDCDDADPIRRPGITETCDGADHDHDEDCDPTTFGEKDADLDGYYDATCCNEDRAGVRSCGNDCDDALATVHPLATEVCDGRDNDCNGSIDEDVTTSLYRDQDHDGFGTGEAEIRCDLEEGWAYLSGDCDDANDALVVGSLRCDGLQYQRCDAGQWSTPQDCGGNASCRPQPNGSGICL